MAVPNLLKKSFGSYARYALSFLVSFLLIPFMLEKVGTEAFGLWSLLFSLLGFFGLMDSGMGVAVVKVVGEAKGSLDVSKRNRVLSAISSLYLLLSVAAFAITFVIGFFVSDWLVVPDSLRSQAFSLFWILSLRAVVLQLPLSLFRGVLFGDQQVGDVNAISAIQNLLYGLVAWWLLANGYGIVAVGAASLLAMLVEHLLYLAVSFRRVASFRLSLRWPHFDELRDLFSFGRHQFFSDVSAMVLLQMDLILVQCFFTLNEVAIYAVALRLSTHSYYLVKQFVNLLGPRVAELMGSGKEKEIQQIILDGTRIALVVALPLWVGFLFLGDTFLYHWVGPSVDGAYLILSLLITAMLVGVPTMVGSVVLAMGGEHVRTSRVAVASVVTNLVASCVLGWSLGLVGIALGTLVAKTTVEYPGILRRILDRWQFSLKEWIRYSFVPLILPTFAQVCLLQLLAVTWIPGSLAEVLGVGVLSVLIYATVAYVFLGKGRALAQA